ncbi:MAG: anti-sigma factor [Vulcanimicrobiaceae bacterium]
MIHDDELLDSIAVLALGALPEVQARELAAHVASCGPCRSEYDGLRGAADALGYAAELPVERADDIAARRLKTRVMTAVRATFAPEAASADTVRRTPTSGARPAWLRYGLAAAAVLVIGIALDDASVRRAGSHDAVEVATLRRRVAAQATVARTTSLRLAQIVAPGSRHFPVRGGEVIASGGRVIVALRDLPALPKGKVYQAWTLAKGATAVAPSVTFAPAPGVTVVVLPERARGLAAVAVSVEPRGGSKAPTSTPRFVRPIS